MCSGKGCVLKGCMKRLCSHGCSLSAEEERGQKRKRDPEDDGEGEDED